MQTIRRVLFLILALLAGGAGLSANEPGAGGGIPFRLEDGLIWVKVASGRSVLDFVVDSGAGSTVLSLQAARRLGLKFGAPCPVYGVERNGVAYRIEDFSGTMGDVSLKREIYAVNLRDPGQQHQKHRRMDGLLGQDFFRGRVVRINFQTQRLQLLEKADAVSRSHGVVLPLRYQRDAMCVPVGVNRLKPEWTRLDTGCSTALEWAANLEAPAPRRGGKPSIGRAGTEQATADEATGEVQLGSERVAGVKIGIHPRAIFPGEAGLLGMGLLSRYRVTIDARRMQLVLEKP